MQNQRAPAALPGREASSASSVSRSWSARHGPSLSEADGVGPLPTVETLTGAAHLRPPLRVVGTLGSPRPTLKLRGHRVKLWS